MSTILYELFNTETINIDLNKQEHLNMKIIKKYTLQEKKKILDNSLITGELVDPKYKFYTFSRSETYEDRF